MVGLRFDFEDVPFEVEPERRVGDGQFADLWPFVKIVRRRR